MWHACAFIITHYISILFHSGLNSEQQNGQADPTVQQQVKLSKFRLSTNVVSFRSPEWIETKKSISELLATEACRTLEVLTATCQVWPRPVLDVIAIGQFLRYQSRAIFDVCRQGLAIDLVNAAEVEFFETRLMDEKLLDAIWGDSAAAGQIQAF